MTDTDSDMMRRQQNMDVPQTIGDGKRGARPDLSESDGRDRRSALDGRDVSGNGQDAVLAQNATDASPVHGATAPHVKPRSGGLVQRGRSLLGR